MKKLALLSLAVSALTATARVFTINLGNGDLKLDHKYLQYGSADLIGIECITASDSGAVKLSVGKHMEAKKKIVNVIPVYETNVVVTLLYKEYDWVGRSIHTYHDTLSGWTSVVTNDFTFKQNINNRSQFSAYLRGYNWYLTDTGNARTNFTITGTVMTRSGSCNFSQSKSYDSPTDDLVISIRDHSPSHEGYTFDLDYTGIHTEIHDVYEYTTNIVQVGSITNITWQPVNRTCYQSVINTNLNHGIIINYIENPIRLFRNDYLRSTCPINDETNPGIYHAIMKDEGAASIIL